MNPGSNHWYDAHANLATLANYLAERGDSALEVAHAVEMPWRYTEAYDTAQAILTERNAKAVA